MNTIRPQGDQLEIADRAEEIFARKILPKLEESRGSRFVAIDVDSEDFELDENDLVAINRLLSRHSQARVWLRKTNSPFARTFGSARRPEARA